MEYQTDLRLHPSSDLVSRPLAAALALTTAGADLLAAIAEIFFVETEQGAAPKKAIKSLTQCVSNSEAASGLLTGYQGTDALANLPGSLYCSTHAPDSHPRGWVRRAGNTPPCAASFFPYSFFAEEERIWPPEGASPLAWKKFKTQRLPASKKIPQVPTAVRKQQRSGKRPAHRLSGHGCTRKSAW